MFNHLTYHKKLRFLGIGFGIALVLIYFLAIRKTVTVKQSCTRKEEKLIHSKEQESKISKLRTQIVELDGIIGEMPDTTKKVMDLLLEHMSAFCNKNGCILKEIPGTHLANDANFEIETNFITVEGNFKTLLELVYMLEQKKKTGGRVSSTKFFTKKDFNTQKTSLYLTITVQHFKKLDDVKNNS